MKLFRALPIIFLIAFISTGCGSSGGGGDNNGGDNGGGDNNTSKTIISGTVTLPGYTPAGSLWMVVDGLDGNIYGSGPSKTDGTFSIETSIPPDNGNVLLYAVDPNNPEAGAMAYVSLEKNINGQAVSVSNEATNLVLVNAKSTAEVYVSMVNGLTPPEFSPEDVAMVNKIADEMLIDPPSFCAVDKTPLNAIDKNLYEQFIEQAGKSRSVVGEYIDKYVNEAGSSLILRAKRAQNDISKNVTSLNQADGWRIDEGTAIATTINVLRTRIMLEFVLGDGLFGGLTKESVTLEELDDAAGIIIGVFGKNGFIGGAGNCMEKGLAGAFIASRFKEFKQVALVAVESPQWSQPHAFSIACQKDVNVWDLQNVISKRSANEPIPNGLFDAECMVIDPWLGITKELTPDTVKDLKWQEFEFVHVMSVDFAENNQLKLRSAYNIVDLSNVESSPPIVCPIDPGPTPKLCAPFSIPGSPNTPPEADSQSVTTDANTSKIITLTGSDLDWDSLTFNVMSQPEHGSLSGTPPDMTYTPDTDYSGPDSFTFVANDGEDDSATGTINITVESTLPSVTFRGTGISTASLSTASFGSASCPTTATWEITLYNEGWLAGLLRGTYSNANPQDATSYGGVQCVASSKPHDIDLFGTHSNGTFEITGGTQYYDETNSIFLSGDTPFTGTYNNNSITAHYTYIDNNYGGGTLTLEHEFNLPKQP